MILAQMGDGTTAVCEGSKDGLSEEAKYTRLREGMYHLNYTTIRSLIVGFNRLDAEYLMTVLGANICTIAQC